MATMRKDGRWMARIRRKGERPLAVYGKTEQEAEEKLAALAKAGSGPAPPAYSAGTFAEFVYSVYTPHVYPDIRNTSRRKYDELFRYHILPALGRLPIAEIGIQEMQALRQGLKRTDRRKGPLSPTHVREIVLREKEVLKLAHGLGYTSRTDWRIAKAPDRPRKKPRIEPDPDFTERLLLAAEGTYMVGPLFCALFLGLRRGEICSLKWKAIDRKNLRIVVSEQLQAIDGQVRTKGDTRVIPVPQELMARLDEWGDKDSEYVFTVCGAPLRPNEVSKQTPRLCEKAQLPRCTLHDLRAFAASNLFALGVDPITVMEILGHTNLNTTMIYAYGREHKKRKALGRLLKGLKTRRHMIA